VKRIDAQMNVAVRTRAGSWKKRGTRERDREAGLEPSMGHRARLRVRYGPWRSEQ